MNIETAAEDSLLMRDATIELKPLKQVLREAFPWERRAWLDGPLGGSGRVEIKKKRRRREKQDTWRKIKRAAERALRRREDEIRRFITAEQQRGGQRV